ASEDLRPGDVFIAMHWGERFMSGAGANALTVPAVDPRSKQPELKHAAVRIERFDAAWRKAILLAAETPERALDLQRQVTPLLQRFDYGAMALSQPERAIFLGIEVASAAAPAAGLVAEFDRLSGLAPLPDSAGLPQARGRTVCSCLGVSEEAIRAAAAAARTLPEVQAALRCGTQCGSCVTEVKRLIAESPRHAAAMSATPMTEAAKQA